MKQQRDLSLWLMALVACSGAASVGCGDAGDSGPLGGGENSGVGASAGAAAGDSGSATGGAGSGPVAMGGSSSGAGRGGSSGGSPMAGTSSGGTSGGQGGMAGGGQAGLSGGGGDGPMEMPFGVVSCQPAFEVTCKPPIEFVNGDPNGRGKVFTDAIPDVEATMQDIACVVCSMLYRTPDEIPQNKHPSKIRLVLDEHGGVAQAGGGQIQFDLDYIAGWANRSPEQIKREMMGVLQHETTHLYQNYGNGGTGEGGADLVRVRMGYYEPNRWSKGGDWRDAYTTSGNFYSWLTGPCSFHEEHYSNSDLDFPYKLNKALGGTSGDGAYSAVDDLVKQLFGKSADELWSEYQNTAF